MPYLVKACQPETGWIIGYDDVGMAAWDSFDLTTVRQPSHDMASLERKYLWNV
jgi:LacI family transcriptional regulator